MKGWAHRIWTARARWVPALPALAALVVALVLIAHANRHFLRPDPALLNDFDEGYAMALARRMIEGRYLPYVDGVSHRGPVFYWLLAGFGRLIGYESWLVVRVLAFASMMLTVLFAFGAAAWIRRSFAGAIMATSYSAVCLGSMELHDGLALNSEHVLNVFVFAGFFCLVAALHRRVEKARPLLLFSAAALTMLGGLSKQVGLAALVPFGFWVLCAALTRREMPKRARLAMLAWFVAGALLPLLIVIARYAIAGELSTFVYYFLTYNTRVYVGGIGEHSHELFRLFWTRKYDALVFGAPLLGLALVFAFYDAKSVRDLPRAFDARGAEGTIALSAAVALLVANSGRRDFGHYYLQLIPWAGLFGGLVLERVITRSGTIERRRWFRAFLVRFAVLAPAAAFAITGWTVAVREFARIGRGAHFTNEWPVCKYIDAHTKPTDSIFIWGFEPAPYTACKRRAASRYVFTTFPAGFIPFLKAPIELEHARASPGSREILLRELQTEKPPLIFDSPKSLGGRSLEHYDFLRRWVAANYCKVPVVDLPFTTWVTRSSPECQGR